ncbi:MAG TPA: hypothetical protein VKD72_34840 [Gemmataceae bacterium]|nr:hypothetical protein [Gemmataceae bacterium]
MRFRLPLVCLCTLVGPLVRAEPTDPFTELDYTKVERSIAKEPKYVGPPRYALFIFDPQARFRV